MQIKNKILTYSEQFKYQLWKRDWSQKDFITFAKNMGCNFYASEVSKWTRDLTPSKKSIEKINIVFQSHPYIL